MLWRVYKEVSPLGACPEMLREPSLYEEQAPIENVSQ
jgi:hypothetical protein